MRRHFLSIFLIMLALTTTTADAQDKLSSTFMNPGKPFRPRVWWHWLDANITTDGIRKDLLWMKSAGIAGVHNFDANRGTPQIVPHKLIYMTPEWQKAFGYAVSLADSLDMEFTIASSPGWSETGGPWVKQADGMKRLVWRDAYVKGGRKLLVKLPKPYSCYGIFQDLGSDNPKVQNYYEDIATLAVRVSGNETYLLDRQPVVTASSAAPSVEALTDGSLTHPTLLQPDSKGRRWIQYAFKDPVTVSSITIADQRMRGKRDTNLPPADKVLEVSDDGTSYRQVMSLPNGGAPQATYSFAPQQARFFRITYNLPQGNKNNVSISEFRLSSVPSVNHFEEKVGFAVTADDNCYPTPEGFNAPSESDVIDISQYVDSTGTLTWKAPKGWWRIVRVGFSLTGKKNHPAIPEATGLEVDKMDPQAINSYYTTYINMYLKASNGMMGKKGIQNILNDSYEAGTQTWTRRMPEEFKSRRGYDLIKWLPVLTGQIIGSAAESDQFLWDWRKTISEMIAEYSYDAVSRLLQSYNLGKYAESQELGRVYLVDGMDAKRSATVPMGAFWMYPSKGIYAYPNAEADIKESSSVAHIYGQNLAAAESFTCDGLSDGAWSFCPENLKPMADVALWCGLNRFVVHTSPHQPSDTFVPGLGLGKYGQWFDRHETWADYAKYWTDYLARSSYFLQQGHYVADIAYYYGEDNCITGLYYKGMPTLPNGYNYDFVSPHALCNVLEPKDGRLVTASGMDYKVLVLDPNVRYMSIEVLRRLQQLAHAGVLICGARPAVCAGRDGSQQEFDSIVADIWSAGRQNVASGQTVDEFLHQHGIEPDAVLQQPDGELRFVHRRDNGTDIYWLCNKDSVEKDNVLSLRIAGKRPELFHADNGAHEDATYTFSNGRTLVPLHLNKYEAVFVVLRDPATAQSWSKPAVSNEPVATIAGPWRVEFQQGRGAPAEAEFSELKSYTESNNDSIRYFSGKATYNTTFQLSAKQVRGGGRLLLNLGNVKNIAEVWVNGQHIGVGWKYPFCFDITEAVHKGTNKVQVAVTNLWVNRLIGDAQPGVTNPVTHTALRYYEASSPLLPSGLLGPVSILREKTEPQQGK